MRTELRYVFVLLQCPQVRWIIEHVCMSPTLYTDHTRQTEQQSHQLIELSSIDSHWQLVYRCRSPTLQYCTL